ncbi:hypothetical protein [Tardisphaera saccharovorans]
MVYRFDKSGKQRRKHVVIVITVDAKGRGCWALTFALMQEAIQRQRRPLRSPVLGRSGK